MFGRPSRRRPLKLSTKAVSAGVSGLETSRRIAMAGAIGSTFDAGGESVRSLWIAAVVASLSSAGYAATDPYLTIKHPPVCKTGKLCGDHCIPKSKVCHKD